MKKSIIVLVISFLFFSCSTTKVEKTSFNGMIYDGDNEPVSGVKIQVDEKHQTVSDMYGRFYLDNLSLSTNYTLTASKKDYETVILPFEFQNITQIVYITMYSSDQLLKEAEKVLSEDNIDKAKEFVKRSEDCSGGKTISSQYLSAVILYREGRVDEALDLLKSLINYGNKYPYIYLFLADISEYDLNDIETAKTYLQKFLDNSYDFEIEKRYKKLCAQ